MNELTNRPATSRPRHPIRTAIAGIGGFGKSHHAAAATLETSGDLKVVATCDPATDNLDDVRNELQFTERGISVYHDFDAMMDAHGDSLGLCTIATPIHLHAPMHAAAVRRGIPCYLEKPPTLDPEEFAGMLEIEATAAVPTNVGFSYISQPGRIALKQRMIEGEFGTLERLTFLGLVQRAPSYFTRNSWAGRLLYNGRLLLDSCLGNAMSHFVNALLFFGGTRSTHHWARPVTLASELYRANSIEGPDTIFATGTLEGGAKIFLAATHACSGGAWEERIECANATIEVHDTCNATINWKNGTTEIVPLGGKRFLDNFIDYVRFLLGDRSRPAQLLSDSAGFVEINALYYLAARSIHDVPEQDKEIFPNDSLIAIRDIETILREAIISGKLPSEMGVSWGRPGGSATPAEIGELRDVVSNISSQSR